MLELIAKTQSFTQNKEYTLSRDSKTGDLSCNCPAWIFQKKSVKNRRCKHIKRFLEDIGVD